MLTSFLYLAIGILSLLHVLIATEVAVELQGSVSTVTRVSNRGVIFCAFRQLSGCQVKERKSCKPPPSFLGRV